MQVKNNTVKTTVDAIMDNVMIKYDDLSSIEMEDKITYYINNLVTSLVKSEENKENLHRYKTTNEIMDNIKDHLALFVYHQVKEKISTHIDILLDTLHKGDISFDLEHLHETTRGAIMEDIRIYIAFSVFYKVQDQIDYFIGCLFNTLRIDGIIPRVEDEVDNIISKIEDLVIKVNLNVYTSGRIDSSLEGKRISVNEVDPEEEPEDDITMEDSFTESELDQQLSAYFREGGMKMNTGYYPSPPKKRSRDNNSDDENSLCGRIKTS